MEIIQLNIPKHVFLEITQVIPRHVFPNSWEIIEVIRKHIFPNSWRFNTSYFKTCFFELESSFTVYQHTE